MRVFDPQYANAHNRQTMDYKRLTNQVLSTTGETLAQLAEKTGVTQPTITRWKKGATPDTENAELLKAYAKKLGILSDFDEFQDDFEDVGRRPVDGILEIDVRVGLGAGGTLEGREVRHDGEYVDPVKPEAWKFPTRFMREEIRATESQVIILETDGDSMEPTIGSGERIIVHTGMRQPSPDGIFALRDTFGNIIAKRLQVLRKGDPPRVLIISDNKAHATEEVGLDEITIVGRVLWGLKRL